MPAHFTQQPHDPEHEPEVRSRFPISAMIWIPLGLVFAVGVVMAAKFGYEKAIRELSARPNPAAVNETLSEPFDFDPGDDPIVFAAEQKALRDHLSAPPGSSGSGTLVVSEPMRLRIVTRDGEFVRVIVIGGSLEDQRFWARGERLLAAKRGTPPAEVPDPRREDAVRGN